MKSKEIRDLIDFIAETGLNEVSIETEEIKLSVKRSADIQQIATPVAVQTPAPIAPIAGTVATESSSPTTANEKHVEVKSPMIGTFYRSANPESAPFVEVGDTITVGQTVCVVEAMKLFNEIEAEISGTIVKVLVDNSSPVEYDQPLFLVDPS